LFIRDALYWLARSAPQRQATGGSSERTSEENFDYEVEPSTSGGFQVTLLVSVIGLFKT